MSGTKLPCWLLGFGLFALFAISGCGGPKIALNNSVKGKVTIDGTPLVGVMVQFVPDSEVALPGSSSITDSQGAYDLQCDNGEAGAVIGKHKVLVFPGRADLGGRRDDAQGPQGDDAATASKSGKRSPSVPLQYTIATKTPLSQEINAEQHSYDLVLKGGGK